MNVAIVGVKLPEPRCGSQRPTILCHHSGRQRPSRYQHKLIKAAVKARVAYMMRNTYGLDVLNNRPIYDD